ncbi:hypothetical protein P7B04_24425, partial [Sphingobium yanoikuyae]|nr:hypothetical protein [Sphingobium yanoikuyae]
PALRDIPSPGSILDGNTGSLLSGNLHSLGLTREEIAQAMAFTIFMNSGAALTYTARVFDVIDALPEN